MLKYLFFCLGIWNFERFSSRPVLPAKLPHMKKLFFLFFLGVLFPVFSQESVPVLIRIDSTLHHPVLSCSELHCLADSLFDLCRKKAFRVEVVRENSRGEYARLQNDRTFTIYLYRELQKQCPDPFHERKIDLLRNNFEIACYYGDQIVKIFKRAAELYEQKEYAKAHELYRRALLLKPNDPQALAGLERTKMLLEEQ